MPDFFYPVVSAEESQRIVTLLKLAADPAYLADSECPYDEALKIALSGRAPGAARAARPLDTEKRDDMDKWQRLEVEARELFEDLKAESGNLGNNDVAEKMSYYRTATSLLDKLIGLQERAAGLRQLSEFQNMVLGFLDELCTPDQRTELMERLKSVTLTEGGRRVSEEKPVEKAPVATDAGTEPG